MVQIELIYVAQDKTIVHLKMDLKPGSTVADALTASAIYQAHPETRDYSVGVYAKQVTLDTILKEGDRIEIYRPLAMDPKENRRHRAKVKK